MGRDLGALQSSLPENLSGIHLLEVSIGRDLRALQPSLLETLFGGTNFLEASIGMEFGALKG